MLIALALAGLCAWSCNDDSVTPVQNVQVSGRLLAWYCQPENYALTPQPLYTVATGRRAIITFYDTQGRTHATITGESSEYSLEMPTGSYRAVVETDHTVPDTIPDISISDDTTMDLSVVYDWTSPDTISAEFYYYYGGDSLGRDSEMVFVNLLQNELGDMIDTRHAGRIVALYGSVYPTIIVQYRTPIGVYPMWHVYREAAWQTLRLRYSLPGFFRVRPDPAPCR